MNKLFRKVGIMGLALFACGAVGRTHAQSLAGTAALESWNGVTRGLTRFCLAMDMATAPMRFNELGSGLLGLPNLAGLDVDRTIRFFLVRPGGVFAPPALVARIPLADRNACLEALRDAHGEAVEERDGTWRFGPAAGGNARVVRFAENDEAAYMGRREDLVDYVATLDLDDLSKDLAELSGGFTASFRLEPFWPTVEMVLSMALPTAAAEDPDAGSAPAWKPLLDLFRGLERVGVGLDVDGGGISVDIRTEAGPGSSLAKIFEMQRPPSARYASFLPVDACVGVVGGGMDSLSVLAEPYALFFEAILRRSEGGAEAARKFRDAWMKSAVNYSGDYVVGVFDDPRGAGGLVYASLYGVKDPGEAEKQLEEAGDPGRAGGGAGFGASFGRMVPAGRREIRGVTVHIYRLPVPDEDLDLPAPVRKWLDGLVIEACVSGNDLITGLGSPGCLDGVLDRFHAPGAASFPGQVKALFGFPDAAASEFFRFSPVALVRAFVQTLPGVDAGDIVASLPQPSEGIGGVEVPAENGLWFRMRLPIAACRNVAALGNPLSRLGEKFSQPALGEANGEDGPEPEEE